MGLGRFGGGLAAAESLLAEGRQVLVTDLAEEVALQAAVTKLRETFGGQVRFRLGGHEQEDFAQAELVIANPAIPTLYNLSPDSLGIGLRHHRNRTHAGSTQ